MALPTNLTGIQINCRSLNNKLGELKLMLYSRKPSFMALSETWITKAKFQPKFHNYNCEWKNREVVNVERGGGLGLVIRRGIQYEVMDIVPYNNGSLEFQAIKIYMHNNTKLAILHVYNPNKFVHINEIINNLH